MSLRIALAQLNVTVGDLAGNAARILAAARDAAAEGAQLLVTPELSLCGYPPEDLLLRPAFIAACQQQWQQLALQLSHQLQIEGAAGLAEQTGIDDLIADLPMGGKAARSWKWGARRVGRHGREL